MLLPLPSSRPLFILCYPRMRIVFGKIRRNNKNYTVFTIAYGLLSGPKFSLAVKTCVAQLFRRNRYQWILLRYVFYIAISSSFCHSQSCLNISSTNCCNAPFIILNRYFGHHIIPKSCNRSKYSKTKKLYVSRTSSLAFY